MCFNPWYVGGGVKRDMVVTIIPSFHSFNPWYVGGGVKSLKDTCSFRGLLVCFNPWYVGGGVKRGE